MQDRVIELRQTGRKTRCADDGRRNGCTLAARRRDRRGFSVTRARKEQEREGEKKRPISSIFDFLTFYVLLHFFHTSEAQFHTGWFVESLATQTLVLFVIRTSKNPLRSRPSGSLTATCLAAVAVGIYLPFSPLARVLGFTPLPATYFAFLAVATGAYLLLVEAAKRRLLRKGIKDAAKAGDSMALAT